MDGKSSRGIRIGAIVGIGASSGGLEALKEFFGAMPSDTGMAFVVVQHLDPTRESRMAEILGKSTTMRVVQADDGLAVEPNVIYTNPAGRQLGIRKGRLVLGRPVTSGHLNTAVDHFLISLAKEQGCAAICVILSGSTGTDGPRGVRAVRVAGGVCIVQEPGTAQFSAMPQAVIDAGLADHILGPAQMPAAILGCVRNPLLLEAGQAGAPVETMSGELEAILQLLLTRVGSDYTHYKRAMLGRRILRRMGLRQVAGMGEYLALLQREPDELTKLARDMLIGVSSFFRDAGVFETLYREVIVPLVQSQPDGVPLRAWVAGCATGEEAYSIAMLLLEARAAAGRANPVQVFATDVDEQALDTARAGMYPESVVRDIPTARLDAFFTRQDQSFRVAKHLREVVVFSRHNLLADPPFSKLDLVCCRNVLIYLEPAAQKKTLSVFCFALKVGGHLLLGRSEGVSKMNDFFEPVSRPDHLYRLVQVRRRVAGEFPLCTVGRPLGTTDRERAFGESSLLSQANLEAILRHFDVSLVLIDAEGTILYFRGNTEKYLGHPKGPANLNILNMVGGALSAKLRRTIDRACQQDEPVCLLRVSLPHRRPALSNLTVTQLSGHAGGKFLAVIFEDAEPLSRATPTQVTVAEDETLVAQLEAEVKTLRAELRTSVETSNVATEELRSANEEVMSTNEELQSANEELEASKEEMQSFNEELNTVNSQLNEKVGELTETTNDLANLLGASEIATVFLDAEFRIRRFTPRATALLNVIDSDIGRPVGHITHSFSDVDLAADAGQVLATLSPMERDEQARDGRWYSVNILPYCTHDNRVEGVVITFTDVTRLKQAEEQLRHEKIYAERVVEMVRHPLLILDRQLRILSANLAFYEVFRCDPAQTAGRVVYELDNGQWDIPQLRKLIEVDIPKDSNFKDFRVEHDFDRIGRKVMLISGQRIDPIDGIPERLLLTLEDVTESERSREELRALNADLEMRVTQRTALAEHRSLQLRELAAKLARTEQTERERLARLLHDNLQQLLVGVRFQLVALRSRVADEPSRAAVDKMTDLVRQALATTKSLAVDLSPAILYEAGLDAALPGLVRQMRVQHDLTVETVVNTTVPADEDGVAVLLFAAVRELLLNVVKHAHVDSARVQVDQVGDNQVRITVSDLGSGFSPDTLQASGSTVSGLGLFGLKQRLEYVGGQCEIDSAPGRGTRVMLTARLGCPRRVAVVERDIPAGEVSFPEPTGNRIRVLLVDDHAVVRQGLAGVLNAEPDIAVIAEACDGEQAIELARRNQPDVIVMDISMPRMNGIEATRAILGERPATKIIGFSMYQEVDRAKAMQQAGAVGYVNKGGPLEELLAAIRKCVPNQDRSKDAAGKGTLD